MKLTFLESLRGNSKPAEVKNQGRNRLCLSTLFIFWGHLNEYFMKVTARRWGI